MTNISRRQFIRGAVAMGTLAALSQSNSERAYASENTTKCKPNVLLIMTDQQRKDTIGTYGNRIIRTANLDLLARTGVLFQNCYSQSPVCMPARATIFTGRYPAAHGVWANGVPLPKDEITLAHIFAKNGYRTGGAGKFHFIPHYPYRSPMPTMENHPEPFYGFQEFHLGEDGRSGEHHLWIKRTHPEYYNKPDHQIPIELHNSYWVASQTIDFIRKCASKNEPFFAFCSFVDPHHSYNPPSPYREMYKEKDMPLPIRRVGELDDKPPYFKKTAERLKRLNERVAYNRTQYYGEVTFIDDSIGRILAALDDLNLRDNTLIVFVADHGDMLGDHWLYYKGRYHYRTCANVPLIFNWNGHLKEGKIINGMVQQTDLFPTITELVGIANPPGIQGKSLAKILTTESEDTGYEYAYIESVQSGEIDISAKWHNRHQGSLDRNAAEPYTIRSLKWRLSYYPGKPFGELYDLEKDPDEFVNLWNSKKHKNEKQRLKEILLERIIATRDPLPLRINYY